MPRPAKGPRLWPRRQRLAPDGSVTHHGVWLIRDRGRDISTGCGLGDRPGAERALGRYIAEKHAATRTRDGDPARIPIADVIAIWLQDRAHLQARQKEAAQRAGALIAFFAEPAVVRAQLRRMAKPARYDGFLADLRGDVCRAYAEWRIGSPWKSARPQDTGNPARLVGPAAPRRELEDLRAAINHHRREGWCRAVVEVTLPPKAPARERWLTRDEAARLLWGAWRARDPLTGRPIGRHIARFILAGLYTGSRAARICQAGLAPDPSGDGRGGWIDTAAGIFYRKGWPEAETNKRARPARLPQRFLAHARRWVRRGIAGTHLVEWNGRPVRSVRKGFASAVAAAGLGPEVTPHVLRHTAATWLMLEGCDLWQAAGWLSMTVEQLERGYGHHHPDHQRQAVEAIGRQRSPPQIRHRYDRTEPEQTVAVLAGPASNINDLG